MDMNRLEELIYETIVEQIAAQVVETLKARSRQALVLFTGTALGLDKAVPGLKTLAADGFDLRCVLSVGGRKTLTAELRHRLGLDSLLAGARDALEPEADSLLDGRGLVLVPTLSITTAAKVACCIRDCIGASLVARALERGIPVIAAVDGCCPDNPGRQADLFMVSEPYKARMRSHLECLQSYGIQLVRAGKLAEAARSGMTFPVVPLSSAEGIVSVEPAIRYAHADVPAPVVPPSFPVLSTPVVGGKQLFSRADALDCPAGSELRLDRTILVTPLALDILRARNVRLIQP